MDQGRPRQHCRLNPMRVHGVEDAHDGEARVAVLEHPAQSAYRLRVDARTGCHHDQVNGPAVDPRSDLVDAADGAHAQGAADRRVVVVVVEEQPGDDLGLLVTRPARRCLRDRPLVADDDDPDGLLEPVPRDRRGRRHTRDAEDEGRRVAQVPGRETSEGDTEGHGGERKGHVGSHRADAGEAGANGRAAGVEPGDHAQENHSGRDDWLLPDVAGEDDAHGQRDEDLGEQECPRAVHQPATRRCRSPEPGSDEGAVQDRVDRAGRDGSQGGGNGAGPGLQVPHRRDVTSVRPGLARYPHPAACPLRRNPWGADFPRRTHLDVPPTTPRHCLSVVRSGQSPARYRSPAGKANVAAAPLLFQTFGNYRDTE